MFSALKKSKTLRSLLSAAALFTAGTPVVAQAADKTPPKAAKTVLTPCEQLAAAYTPVCEQLEENLPYCYLDDGVIAAGIGVHLKDFSAQLDDLVAFKLTLKEGTVLNLEKTRHAHLFKMADANWKDPKTVAYFPEVAKVEEIKLKDCAGDFPIGTAKRWDKEQFIVLPKATLSQVNKTSVDFFVQKAYQHHPNLFQLPTSAQFVVVDLVYNLGSSGYLKKFPKFRAAVAKKDLVTMRKECETKKSDGTKDVRRNMAKKALMNAAIWGGQKRMTKSLLLPKIKKDAGQEASKYAPPNEPELWKTLDIAAGQSFDWYQTQTVLKVMQSRRSDLSKK